MAATVKYGLFLPAVALNSPYFTATYLGDESEGAEEDGVGCGFSEPELVTGVELSGAAGLDAMGLDGDKYELKLIMAFGVPAETQVIDAIDSNPDGSINYWRDEAQVHHVPKRPLADVLV